MNKVNILFSAACLSLISTLVAQGTPIQYEKSNALDFTYTFNKSDIKNLSKPYKLSTDNNQNGQDISPNFGWGEQGQVSYYHRFKDSMYSLMLSATGLHTSYQNKVSLKTGEAVYFDNLNIYGNSSVDTYYSIRNQFNFGQLDLFVKADLEETKHALFAVYGGAIVAGYRYKSMQKGNSWVQYSSQIEKFNVSKVDTDYFVGPNAKIYVNAPFFKNHLQLTLRLGAGFMMSFDTYTSTVLSQTATEYDKNYAHNENVFRFCFQYDVLAQVAFCFKNFCITSGINQFYYQTPKTSNLITFGGPFAGLSFQF